MSNRNSFLLFGAALLLSGCANGVSIGPITSPAAGAQVDRASPDLTAGGKKILYLSIVDGLIKQNRQGAALAFLDSYRQSGEALSPRYWLLRGNALWGVHRDSDAVEAFSELRGTALAPQGWNGQGRIAAGTEDWSAAEANFRKAVEGNPANADFLNNLAFAELHLDKAGDAAVRLEQAHELEPGSDRILINLGIALTAKGDSGRVDTIFLSIKDDGYRKAMRETVKSGVIALNVKGKS